MSDFDPSWADAIASIESGGQQNPYSTVTPSPGGRQALGKYQVMAENVPEWTQAALGQSLTPEQFLSNPDAQDAVFKHRFGSYVDKYGSPQDAASAWFTGRPISAASAGAHDSLGTSGADYVRKFNAALDGPTAIQQAMHQQGGSGMQPMAYTDPGALSTQATAGPGVLAGGAPQQPQGLLGMLGLPDGYGGRSISNRLIGAGAALQSVYNPSGAAALNQQIKAPASDFSIQAMPDGTVIRVNKQTGAVEKLPGNFGNDSSSKWGVIGKDKFGKDLYGYPPSTEEYAKQQQGGPQATTDDSPDLTNVTGQPYLDALTKSKGQGYTNQVQAIIEGRAPYPTGMLLKTPYGQQLASDVTQADPTFETGNAGARIKTRNEFVSGGAGTPAGQMLAASTAIQHGGEMSDALEQMKQGSGVMGLQSVGNAGIPFLSKWAEAANNAAIQGTPQGTAYANFMTARKNFADEVTKFYTGVQGGEGERQRALDNLDGAKSLPELRSIIAQETKLMADKANALQTRWHTGMGPLAKDFPIISAPAQAAMDKINQRLKLNDPTAAPTAPAAPVATPQNKTSNGVSWSLN